MFVYLSVSDKWKRDIMRFLQVLVLQVMGCASLFASAYGEEYNISPYSAYQFHQGVYDTLLQSGEELPHMMGKTRKKNAKEFALHRRPAVEGTPSFIVPTDQHVSSPLKATKVVFVDAKSRPWYVIDRSQSSRLHRTFTSLSAADHTAQPFTMEHATVVRSLAFRKPSYYGWLFTVRNNAYVGKAMLFEFTLYPVGKSHAESF